METISIKLTVSQAKFLSFVLQAVLDFSKNVGVNEATKESINTLKETVDAELLKR